MNVLLCKDKKAKYLAKCFHATCLSPTSKTLINSIKINNFVSWPGLSSDLIGEYLTLSIPTAKVQLNQEKQVLLSTKTLSNPQNENTSDDLHPWALAPNTRTHNSVCSVISSND